MSAAVGELTASVPISGVGVLRGVSALTAGVVVFGGTTGAGVVSGIRFGSSGTLGTVAGKTAGSTFELGVGSTLVWKLTWLTRSVRWTGAATDTGFLACEGNIRTRPPPAKTSAIN